MIHSILRKISFYALLLLFGLTAIFFVQLSLKKLELSTIEKPSLAKSKKSEEELHVIELANKKNIIFLDNVPVKAGNLSSKYGIRKDPFNGRKRMHHGIDIAARSGTNIYPLGNGKVIYAGRKAGYGNIVEILHGGNIISRYAHLKKSLVKKGQFINKNNIIAKVGSTGRSTGPHLHLEILISGKTIDPEIFLIGNVASIK